MRNFPGISCVMGLRNCFFLQHIFFFYIIFCIVNNCRLSKRWMETSWGIWNILEPKLRIHVIWWITVHFFSPRWGLCPSSGNIIMMINNCVAYVQWRHRCGSPGCSGRGRASCGTASPHAARDQLAPRLAHRLARAAAPTLHRYVYLFFPYANRLRIELEKYKKDIT